MAELGGNKKKWYSVFNLVVPMVLLSVEKRTERSNNYDLMFFKFHFFDFVKGLCYIQAWLQEKKAFSLRSQICRSPKNWIRCTHPRTNWNPNNAFLQCLMGAISKVASSKVGRSLLFFSPLRPNFRLATYNMCLLTLQGNAFLGSHFVLAWLQRISFFGPYSMYRS